MSKKYIDLNTIKFQLYNVHDLEPLFATEYFGHLDKESIELYMNSIKDFSDQELYPVFREMDEQPAHFKDGKIIVHPAVGMYMKKGGELGIIAAPAELEDGGLQLPLLAHTGSYAIMEAANNHLPGYAGLTMGSAELILEFGNEDLKEKYASRMMTGEWAGTMCLTEPQAGSSLSDVATTATPQLDGSFKIKGQKIFISGGDHEYSDNFVHLLLARIDGAPAGTKGISLFVVPKNRIKEDGSLEFNDVVTAGISKNGTAGLLHHAPHVWRKRRLPGMVGRRAASRIEVYVPDDERCPHCRR